MCRCENVYFNLYNVTRTGIDYIKCHVNSVGIWKESTDNITDAASFASVFFENSLLDLKESEVLLNTDEENESLINAKLARLNEEIIKQNSKNMKQIIEFQKLQIISDSKRKIITDYENNINKIRLDYNNKVKKNKILKLKHILAQKALQFVKEEHVKILQKNQILINQNEMLTRKNIELIKHKNLLKTECLAKTYSRQKTTVITTTSCIV
jgi:membrane-associated HD superfamily phosphohydrolase